MTVRYNKFLLLSKVNSRCMSSTVPSDHSCKLLVLGGGTGGCSTAAKFANKLGKGNVTVVEPSDVHYYQPMFTLVGGGIKRLKESSRPMSSVLPRNATWIKDSVSKIHPHQNSVTTSNGLKISYEYLVVALGIELHFEKVKGLEEALADPMSGVSSNYSPIYAERTFDNLTHLKQGNAVFSLPNTPIKCAGAPIKACFISEHYVRNAGHRNNVNFYYRTSLPVMFSVKHYADQLMKLADARSINVGLKKDLIEVDHRAKEAKFRNIDRPLDVETIENIEPCTLKGAASKACSSTELEDILGVSFGTEPTYSMLHAVPPMAPPPVLAQSSPELVDLNGYLKINKLTLRHDNFPNIYGIGDCTNLPTSKTAAAVAGQVGILYKNLQSSMEGKDVSSKYDGYTSCPLVTGYGSCIMAEFDYDLQPLETFPLIDQSKEHLSMYIMKKDFMPIIYWHGMMNGYWNGPKFIRKCLHFGQCK